MAIRFNRQTYFDAVRERPFGGSLTQQQVDGQDSILSIFETRAPADTDLRWLAYGLATAKHETGSTMQPIEEYGQGEGMSYGKPDPETGETYYGRGYVQLTWRDNYARATRELDLSGADDLEWHADRALDPAIASAVMFIGMTEGWFRTGDDGKPETLEKYFNDDEDDPFNAREIINGDRNVVPSWSNGVSIGNLIANYHDDFLRALNAAIEVEPLPPEPEPIEIVVEVHVDAPPGVHVTVRQV